MAEQRAPGEVVRPRNSRARKAPVIGGGGGGGAAGSAFSTAWYFRFPVLESAERPGRTWEDSLQTPDPTEATRCARERQHHRAVALSLLHPTRRVSGREVPGARVGIRLGPAPLGRSAGRRARTGFAALRDESVARCRSR